jgi:hypothetical protein
MALLAKPRATTAKRARDALRNMVWPPDGMRLQLWAM